MVITGGCLCKAVRFEIDAAAPLGVRHCWCRVCQYLGAGSGTISATFAKEAVKVTGQLTDYVSVADSGSVMHRRFCAKCGTPVFSEAEPRPHQIICGSGPWTTPVSRGPEGSSGAAPRLPGPVSIRLCRRPRDNRPRRAGRKRRRRRSWNCVCMRPPQRARGDDDLRTSLPDLSPRACPSACFSVADENDMNVAARQRSAKDRHVHACGVGSPGDRDRARRRPPRRTRARAGRRAQVT
jgi:hypothetical protein